VEAVPGLLQDLFDRFFQQGIVPSKPDYCVIDFFYEVICFYDVRLCWLNVFLEQEGNNLLKVESNNGQMVFSRVNIPILSNLLLGMVDLFVLSA
jgi:hypothetical protein